MNRHKKRGFTIIEILVVISLIGVFLLALGKIQASELRQCKLAAAHDGAAARVDAAVRRLRADMWEAKQVTEDGNQVELIIQSKNGSGATWKILGDDHCLLRRIVGDATTNEFALPAPASLTAVYEQYSFPGGWAGPVPYAIRLHIGDEQIFLPNENFILLNFKLDVPKEASK